jgi:hypothetical protein
MAHAIPTENRFSHNIEIGFSHFASSFHLISVHPLGCVHDCLEDRLIAGTPAIIPGQCIDNFVAAGMRILIQQGFRNQDHTRSAITALNGKFFEEGFLDGVEIPIRGQAFESHDRLPFELFGWQQARHHWLTVDQDGATTTASLAAAGLRGCVAKLLAQYTLQGG